MEKIFFKIIGLVIISSLILISCNFEERKLKKTFNDKIWVIDSTKMSIGTTSGPLQGYILKPTKDSVFNPYKDHILLYESFKINGDTLFLKENGINSPYKVKRIDNNSIHLISLYKANESDIYLTDLTDLFDETPFQNSNFIEFFNEYTWYLTKVSRTFFSDEVIFYNVSPDYYLENNAVKIVNNKSFYKDNFLIDNNAICKFTNGSIYVFDTITKTLVNRLIYEKINDNKIRLTDKLNFKQYELKKIDPTILISYKDLPIEVRLKCNEFTAYNSFKDYLSSIESYEFSFEPSSISYEKINECEYKFSVIRINNIYSNAKRTIYYSAKFSENNIIFFKRLN